ncbi:MAG: SWIM zinc finger domain-containing protein [Neomegalonema sp.]|nr:SWIM zinc finger domain-containing protein [Neomegalonema sp.]
MNRLSPEQVAAMAPDLAARKAGEKLAQPGKWPLLAQSDAEGLIWGACQGSGASPYQVVIALVDLGYKCSCPSRKFPCKHVLGLGFLWASGAVFAQSSPSAFVTDWLSRRRGRPSSAIEPARPAPLPVIEADLPPDASADAPSEEERARRAQAAQQRAQDREADIRAGLAAFERWQCDQLQDGLGVMLEDLHARADAAARRLVDAKAAGLAALVGALPEMVLAEPAATRHRALARAMGRLRLIASAYQNRADLPEAMQRELKRLIGWVQERAELLSDPLAPRFAGRWALLGRRALPLAGLLRVESWQVDLETGRMLALIDHLPRQQARAGLGAAGADLLFCGEMIAYPSLAPIEAVQAQGNGSSKGSIIAQDPVLDPACAGIAAAPQVLAEALDQFQDTAMGAPWREEGPLLLSGQRVAAQGAGFALVDAAGRSVRLNLGTKGGSEAQAALLALAQEAPLWIAGLWDGRALAPLSFGNAAGQWRRAA